MTQDAKDAKMAINGPIFFLVQEQAKSVVAIQALQTRMAVLEGLHERLMEAIDDVQQHLSSTAKTKKLPEAHVSESGHIQSTNAPPDRVEKKAQRVDSTGSDQSIPSKPELSKSDSLNKDSGIGGSDSSLAHTPNFPIDEEDELLHLLDLIGQKSSDLLKQVEGGAGPRHTEDDVEPSSSSEMAHPSNVPLLDNLLFEKVDAQRKLSEIRAERDELKRRLVKLELATAAVNEQKIRVQQQLDATLVENQSLQDKIRSTNDFTRKTESLGYIADIERANVKRKYMEYSEKSRLKVSSILKESSVLELQKQLLTYVMENDILRAKLQQDEPSRIARWLKIEAKLRRDLKSSVEEKHRLQEVVQSRELEIASLKDKIRSMEEYGDTYEESSVRNFGMSSTEDWREPGVQNLYTKRTNLNDTSPFSPLGYGDFSKTQSLPAMLLLGAQAKLKDQDSVCVNFNHMYDTGSFTEVPLQHSVQSGGRTSNHHSADVVPNLVDLSSPTEPNFSSTSTLVNSNFPCQPALLQGLSAPNLSGLCSRETLQNWAFAPRRCSETKEAGANLGSAKLVNGHLCWKGTNPRISTSHCHRSASEDISSICTEFDPLSDDNQSCENFVDSLNLSIPLKPSQVAISQLSSIGDSLHSTSLDMASPSSPVLYQETRKVLSARSVDGIRELLLENGYCKRIPSVASYGHSSVALAKSSRHLPVNLINCMHDSSDYSLL